MLSMVRRFAFSTLLLLFLFALWNTPTAAAQTVITQNGYLTPDYPQAGTVIGSGFGVSINSFVSCPGNGAATVTYTASTTPNTTGTTIATIDANFGFAWIPPTPGTYYITAFLTLNGFTNCIGNISSTPITGPPISVIEP
jgi:hypothetical protein